MGVRLALLDAIGLKKRPDDIISAPPSAPVLVGVHDLEPPRSPPPPPPTDLCPVGVTVSGVDIPLGVAGIDTSSVSDMAYGGELSELLTPLILT